VLVAAKANLASVDSHGWTALHFAADKGHASTCRVLIDEGASLTALDHKGQAPLAGAMRKMWCKMGGSECVTLIEAALADQAQTASASSAASGV